jgi:hypothetical protein
MIGVQGNQTLDLVYFHPEERDSTYLRNFSTHLADCTILKPTRRSTK